MVYNCGKMVKKWHKIRLFTPNKYFLSHIIN